jgi:hypothetical protein
MRRGHVNYGRICARNARGLCANLSFDAAVTAQAGEHAMPVRIVAGLVISVGLISLTNETLARGGGGFGGVRTAAPPAVLRAAPFAAIRSHAFRSPFFGRHRSSGGGGAGLWGIGSGDYSSYGDYSGYGNYYPYYDSSGYGRPSPYPYGQPPYPPAANYPAADSAPDAQRVIFLVPYRPGCDSETQKVPSMSGGERGIRIVRC